MMSEAKKQSKQYILFNGISKKWNNLAFLLNRHPNILYATELTN